MMMMFRGLRLVVKRFKVVGVLVGGLQVAIEHQVHKGEPQVKVHLVGGVVHLVTRYGNGYGMVEKEYADVHEVGPIGGGVRVAVGGGEESGVSHDTGVLEIRN